MNKKEIEGRLREVCGGVLHKYDTDEFVLTAEQLEYLLSALAPQPVHEQSARFAIDGAIECGKQGINKPPTDDHWLMEYWQIGQSLAAHAQAGGSIGEVAGAMYIKTPQPESTMQDLIKHGVSVNRIAYEDFVKQPEAAQPAPMPVAIPRSPEEMIEFIGSNFNCMQNANDVTGEPFKSADVIYSLTVHDLLSAFEWNGLHDGPLYAALPLPAQPVQSKQEPANWYQAVEALESFIEDCEESGESISYSSLLAEVIYLKEKHGAAPSGDAEDADLLDIVRTVCSTAAHMRDMDDAKREHYPSPLSEFSPLLLAARQACLERGFTADGLAIDAAMQQPNATTDRQEGGAT